MSFGRIFSPTREIIDWKTTILGPVNYAAVITLIRAIFVLFIIAEICMIGNQSGAVILGACFVYTMSIDEHKRKEQQVKIWGVSAIGVILTILTTIGFGPSKLVSWAYIPQEQVMLVGFLGSALVRAPHWLIWVRIGLIPISLLLAYAPFRAVTQALLLEIFWPGVREARANVIDVGSISPNFYPDNRGVTPAQGRGSRPQEEAIEEDWGEFVGQMEATEV